MDLLEIIEDKHARTTTIIFSQFPVGSWFDLIGEGTISDVILGRCIPLEELKPKMNVRKLMRFCHSKLFSLQTQKGALLSVFPVYP